MLGLEYKSGMKFKDSTEAIETIFKSFPYNNQLKDLTPDKDHIKFTWRGSRFRLCYQTGMVETVDNGFLIGSDIAILAGELIRINWVRMQLEKECSH